MVNFMLCEVYFNIENAIKKIVQGVKNPKFYFLGLLFDLLILSKRKKQ